MDKATVIDLEIKHVPLTIYNWKVYYDIIFVSFVRSKILKENRISVPLHNYFVLD